MSHKKTVFQIRNADFKDFGGAERYPIFLANSLRKCGYESIIASKSPSLIKHASSKSEKVINSLWWSKQNWSGVQLLFLPLYICWQLILYVWYLYCMLKYNPSVVQIQSKDDFIAGTLAGKTLGKKVIWMDHADLKHIFKNIYIWYKNPIGKMVYLCGLITDGILISSNGENKLVCENLKPNSRILKHMVLVYNGVSDVKNKYKRSSNKKFTFGVATRLVTDKGIGEAIEAFDKLSKNNPDVQLKIIGDGPEISKFKNQAKNNKRIVFTGYLSDPLEEINNLDVLLHPTYHESFSITLLEGCMLEVPIITTDIGGNPEIIIDNKTGLLVEPRDADSLYKAMNKLYKNSELRTKLARAAREQYVKKFNFDNIVKEQYVKLYEK